MQERRKSQRVRPARDAPVRLQIMGDGFMESVNAIDVSEGGLGVGVFHNFEGCDTNAQVSVMTMLPGEKAFMAKARIRYVSKVNGTFGVEFLELSSEHLKMLKKYVEKRLALGAEVL